MKTNFAFATIIFALTGLARATCHGNNCARAITGFGPHVKPDIATRIGDCSDFMRATVSPDPSTTTITKTSTTTVTKYTTGKPKKRFAAAEPLVNPIAPRAPVTIFPSVLPYYATKVCAGTSEYSSVCNCWAITPTVTTLATPIVPITTTTTTTATVTVDVTCEMAAICPFNKVNTFPCKKGQKKGPRCACLKGAVNKDPNICVQNLDCKKAKTCKSSDNCEPNEGCVQHHCCGNKKTKICLKYAPGSC